MVELVGLDGPGTAECQHAVGAVEVVRETLAVPFIVPRKTVEGKPLRDPDPVIHFGMLDMGAQISCIPQSVVEAFPSFQQYFVASPDKIKGVGGIACRVFGELRNVPISLGDDQAHGSMVQCRFRVTEGQGY